MEQSGSHVVRVRAGDPHAAFVSGTPAVEMTEYVGSKLSELGLVLKGRL